MKKNTMSRNVILIIIIAIVISIIYFFMNNDNGNNSNNEKVKFNATVLENNGTSLMVKPDENEDELKSSDKISVRIPQGKVLKDLSEFTVGSKVEITYDGKIMESYPAQINAYEVKLNNY